jgi:DNA-binding NtrC family response regulator
VRELANVVRRALFRLRPGELDIQPSYLDVPASTVADEAPAHRDAPVVDVPSSPRSFRDARARALADFERKFLTELLSEHHGNITRAARAVGKDRRALGRLVKKHQLDRTGP